MKTKFKLTAVCCLLFAICFSALAQGTLFTYQGRLNDGAASANGSYDLQFTIYDSPSGGLIAGGPLTNAPTIVTNGLFTVTLDPGAGVFTGAARWLEIGVRTNGSVAAYAILVPRQALTATPYAIFAGGANAAGLTGPIADARLSANVAFLNANQTFSGTNIFSRPVGIGTTSPASQLHVLGANPVRILGDTTTLNANEYVDFMAHSSFFSSDLGGMRIQHQDNGNIDTLFFAAPYGFQANEKMRVSGNGNVGIGVTDPTNKLQVAGTVSAASFQGDGSGLFNVSSGALGNYAFAYNSSVQSVGIGNIFQDVTFATDAQLNGWMHTTGTSQYTNAQTGLYLIEYNAEVSTTSATGTNAQLRATLNGVEIPGSRSLVTLSALNPLIAVSKSMIAGANASDVLTIQFTGSSTGIRLPSGASSTLTIVRIQ